MKLRFSSGSGSEKRRTLTVLIAIIAVVSVFAVVFFIRIKDWREKREFGDFIAIVNSENEVRRYWDDFTLLADDTITDSRCADSFEYMLQACREAGGMPVCKISYISEYKHKTLFDALCRLYRTEFNFSDEEAESYADALIGRPGHSEHQLGTAVDIFDMRAIESVTGSNIPETQEEYICAIARNYAAFDAAQRESFTYAWLCEHSWEYGFVLRYPDGSENSTGKSPNSWHFRYVGELAAKQMHELGICLEEYNTMFY